MKIAVKCFASLANEDFCDFKDSRTYDFDEGVDVHTLMERLSIPRESVKLIFVNNRAADFDTLLAEGDQVALAPASGGM